MTKIKLIVEKNKDGYWGSIDKYPSVFSSGDSIEELVENTQEAVEIYFESISKPIVNLKIELVMDIQQFFEVNAFINITSLAGRIGMNPSLLRQYSKGIKFPSLDQVRKIENAIKQIGKELVNTELQPA